MNDQITISEKHTDQLADSQVMRADTPIDISGETDRILLEGTQRDLYDFKDEEREEDFYRIEAGLTEEIVREISKEKHDPDWMLEFRL